MNPNTAHKVIQDFDEEFLGKEERSIRIDHFRPAELSLQAWEQRGLLLAHE